MKRKISYFILTFFIFFSSILPTSVASAPVSIMPLGDSITHGTASGAKPGEEVSYRKALKEKLVAAGYDVVFVGSQQSESPIAASLNHEGHGGWCASGCYQNRSDILLQVNNFLISSSPDIVLLHIGTNDISSNHHTEEIVSAVSRILDRIFRYGQKKNKSIWVILALIIGRLDPPCLYCPQTTAYNQALRQMAQKRIQEGEKIILVDMEKGAGIDYRLYPVGDMWDALHPYETGYQKMANVWFEALKQILIPAGNNLSQTTQSNSHPPGPAPTSLADRPAISKKQPEPASKPEESVKIGKDIPEKPGSPPLAGEEEVIQFLTRYINQYVGKNADGLMSLFSLQAIQNQKFDYPAIKRMYARFFEESRKLRYQVKPEAIDISPQEVRVRGTYGLEQETKTGEVKLWRGNIEWTLVEEQGKLKIRTLQYQHTEKP